MIQLPKEIIGMITFDDDGNRILKHRATEKQKKIFEQFKTAIQLGKLTDTVIEFEV